MNDQKEQFFVDTVRARRQSLYRIAFHILHTEADAEDAADAARTEGAWDKLDRVAHTVKGNSLAVGDQQMADAAIALRGAAKSQDRGQAAQLIADMKALAEQL